jgi:hypothetical protein
VAHPVSADDVAAGSAAAAVAPHVVAILQKQLQLAACVVAASAVDCHKFIPLIPHQHDVIICVQLYVGRGRGSARERILERALQQQQQQQQQQQRRKRAGVRTLVGSCSILAQLLLTAASSAVHSSAVQQLHASMLGKLQGPVSVLHISISTMNNQEKQAAINNRTEPQPNLPACSRQLPGTAAPAAAAPCCFC